MATEKRYFWMKLDYRRFESGGDMDFLMSQKDGANYVVLYQMLVLNTRNTNGEFVKHLGEVIIPFDVDAIVRDCKYFSKDTVIVALELFKRLGMIYENKDGYLQLSSFGSLVGSECDSAQRVRDKRARDRAALCQADTTKTLHCNAECNENVTPEIRDKRKDIRDKDKKIIDSNYSSADTSSSEAEPPAQKEKVFIQFPVIGSSEPADVYESYVESLIPIYPAIDVKGEIRRAKAWCEANPANRKTQAGLKRFLINWLNKAQNNAPRVNNSNNRRGFGSATNEEIERANEEIRLHGSKDGWIYCNMDEE